MKTIKFFYLLIAMLAIAFSSCSEKESVVVNDLQLNKNELSLLVNTDQVLQIVSGNGGYTVLSSDPAMVQVSLKDETIVLKALKAGETTVILTDSKDKKVTLNVNVLSMLSVETKKISVEKGIEKWVAISSGNGQYEVSSSDNSVVTVSQQNSKIKILGLKSGKAILTVTDLKTKKSQEIIVEVTTVFSLEKSELILNGITKDWVLLVNGQNDYKIEVTPKGIVKATFEPFPVNNINQDAIKIETLTFGEAKVIVINTIHGQKAELNVKVNPIDFEIAKNEITLAVNKEESIKIYQGNGGYQIISKNALVKAEIKEIVPDNSAGYPYKVIQIKGVSVGTTSITVVDAAKKQHVINIQVTPVKDIFEVNSITKKVTLTPGEMPSGDVTIPDQGLYLADQLFKENTTITTFNFNNATRTGEEVFYFAKALQKVEMNAVKTVNYGAFKFVKTLTSISLKSVEVIEASAFYYTSGLKEIDFPKTLKAIESNAFKSSGLTKVTVRATVPPVIHEKSFSNVNAVLFVPKSSLKAYQQSDWSKVFTDIKIIE